jgi:LmbE family N-acetylglucosaminyl deacetylase
VTRREVLRGAAGLASSFVLAAPAMDAVGELPGAADLPSSRLKVIVAGGHPGDPEYGCGGTVARLTSLGHQVVLLYLNDGAWPPTPAPTRIAEATRACELLKARPAYAGQVNGHAVVDNTHYEEYAKLIDAEKPDVIFTQWPIDNHRDHRAITMLTYDAWRQSQKKFSLYYYEVSMARTLFNSPPPITSISQPWSRSNVPSVTPTPARHPTGTTRCRIRSPLFEV